MTVLPVLQCRYRVNGGLRWWGLIDHAHWVEPGMMNLSGSIVIGLEERDEG